MKRVRFCFFAALLLAVPSIRAETTNDLPDFNEVLGLLRTHLAGATEADLNRAAVGGLLTSLRGKVSIVSTNDSASSTNASLAKASLLEGDVANLRIAHVAGGLAGDIQAAVTKLGATNKLKGLVLDLRFGGGADYAAAAAVADLFLGEGKPLLDWGNGVVKSERKNDPIKLPVAVLVNRETGGAAEALAAVLRETGAGLILGGTTEGSAMIGQEFPLQNGQRLHIATSPVKVGDGKLLSALGLKPDIEVSVSLTEERVYLDNPYGLQSKLFAQAGESGSSTTLGGTNRSPRRARLNEAELVRARREGQSLDGEVPVSRLARPNEADLVRARRDGLSLDGDLPLPRNVEPEKPLLRDPALARAVDLLKGLAVVRASRN